MLAQHRARQWANAANLSTLLGLGVSALGGARLHPWREGLTVATGYRLPFPPAPAFTLGNVVVIRCDLATLAARDRASSDLMDHEARHASQYACCLGPVMLLLYLGACAWSWVRCADWWSRNVFEQRAGLAAGGYTPGPTRAERRRAS